MLHYDVISLVPMQLIGLIGMEFYLVIALLYVYLLGNITPHVHHFKYIFVCYF